MSPNGITLESILKKMGQFDPLTVTILDLSDRGMHEISSGIGKCENLVWLDLSRNRISKGLEVLQPLSCLTHLDLSNNRLAKVTDLSGLACLKSIVLDGNQLRTIADLSGVSGCPQLESLSIRGCPLAKEMSLPTLACKLRAMIPSLRRLNGVSVIVEDKMPLDAVLDLAGDSNTTEDYLAKAKRELSQPWIDDVVNEAQMRLRCRRFESKNMCMIDELLSEGKAKRLLPEAADDSRLAGS